jgi:hypothetical protein
MCWEQHREQERERVRCVESVRFCVAHIRDETALNHLQSTYLRLRISTRADLADALGVDT